MKKVYIVFLILLGLSACELPDNVNPKRAPQVTAGSLFSNGLWGMVNQVTNINVNLNITRLFSQYVAQITYVDEGNFNLVDRNIPDNYFREFYRDALMDFKEARLILESTEGSLQADIDNKLAVLTVCEAYIYQVLVDAFGNVPYTEALLGLDNPTPAYDDAQTIYLDLLSRLDVAVADLNAGEGFGSNDLLFSGDSDSWIDFAQALKLRIALRIADVPSLAATAQTAAEEAITAVSGLVSDPAVFYPWGTTPYINDIYTQMVEGGRNDYVPAAAIVDTMNGLNDPRRGLYFTLTDTSSEEGVEKLVYLGGNPGDPSNSYQGFSHFSDAMFQADYKVALIELAEVNFMLAEAAARGYAGAGDAATLYADAITASILSWGGTAGDAAAYLAQAEVAYDAANWKNSIGLQMWIALYNQGIEGWAILRKFDIDGYDATGVLDMPAESLLTENIKRMPYPYVENDINKTNKDAAASAIGGDDPLTHIFWDVN